MEDLSRRAEPEIVLTDAATVAIPVDKGSRFVLSTASSRTLGAPGEGYSGQVIVIRWKNTSGSPITLTLTTGSANSFRYLGGADALNETPAGAVEYIAASYDAADDRWDVIAYSGADFPVPSPTRNYFNPQDAYPLVAGQQGQASLHVQPMQAPNVQFDRIALPLVISNATNLSGSQTVSMWFGLYTRTGSTLSLASSTSRSFAMTQSGTAGSYSQYGGQRLFTIGSTNTLPEGQYYVGIISRTTSGGANASMSQMLCSQLNSNFSGIVGEGSNASIQQTRGLGVYSASTTALPSSIQISELRGTSSLVLRQPSFYLASQTF